MSEESKSPSKVAFGDTQEIDGFVRLIDFIKKEHKKRKRDHDPVLKLRQRKINKYKEIQTELEDDTTKKGLQLKKAA